MVASPVDPETRLSPQSWDRKESTSHKVAVACVTRERKQPFPQFTCKVTHTAVGNKNKDKRKALTALSPLAQTTPGVLCPPPPSAVDLVESGWMECGHAMVLPEKRRAVGLSSHGPSQHTQGLQP